MNSRAWPENATLPLVNVNAQSDSEMQQNFAAVNQLVEQFNQLAQIEGDTIAQMQSIIKALKGLFPYDGLHDQGYVSNAVQKAWPNTHWEIGTTALGPLIDVKTKTDGDGGTYVVLEPAAGPLSVLWGGMYFDINGHYGLGVDGSGDFEILAPADKVIFTSTGFQAAAYYGSDGSRGLSATTGGATFVDGLYTGGTIEGSGAPGTVDEVPDDSYFYCRFNDTGPLATNGQWINLTTFFAGLAASTKWPGAADLTTLGTIAHGTWQGTAIADAYIASATTWTGKQDSLGTGTTGQYLATGPTWQDLDTDVAALGYVDATALAAWTGSTTLNTLGNVTTGTWSATPIILSKIATIPAQTVLGNSSLYTGQVAALDATTLQDLVDAIPNDTFTALGQVLVSGHDAGGFYGTAFAAASNVGHLKWDGSANWSIDTAVYLTDATGSIGNDGNTYGRNNGGWVTVSAGSVTVAADSFYGNNTGSSSSGMSLSAGQALTLLGLGSTAGAITATGDIKTSVSTGSLFAAALNISSVYPNADGTTAFVFRKKSDGSSVVTIDTTNSVISCGTGYFYNCDCTHLRPETDGTSGLVVVNRSGGTIMRFDSTNQICYPNRLVIPTGS
jgi:hypothetical protein